MSDVRLEKVWTSQVRASDGSTITVKRWESENTSSGFSVTVQETNDFQEFSLTDYQFEAIKKAVEKMKDRMAKESSKDDYACDELKYMDGYEF